MLVLLEDAKAPTPAMRWAVLCSQEDADASSEHEGEESSDTEPDTDPAFVDANAAAMKLNRLFLGGGKAGGVVGDETLLEMARERKERAENEPASPKKKRTK